MARRNLPMDYFLARHPLFRALAPKTLETLSERLVLRQYSMEEPVFEEDAPADAVFLLRTGLVKAVKYSPKTEPFAMEIVVPGKLFGMIAVMDKKPYPVSAVCLQSSEAYRIPAPFFEEMLRERPNFSMEVYVEIGNHLRQAQAMRALSKEPVEKRIAHLLCLLSEMMGAELKIRREDVAQLAGCLPETAVRTLTSFRRRNLIGSGWKKIVVKSPERLRALSGQG